MLFTRPEEIDLWLETPLLAVLPVRGPALLVHDDDDLDLAELGFVDVDQTVREPSQGFAPQTPADHRRRLREGLNLLDGAADSREKEWPRPVLRAS
jgi:hypothetical protein